MLTIRDQVYEKTFRASFPELQSWFDQLDSIGGRNCASCNKRKQKSFIKAIEATIGNREILRNRWMQFSGDTHQGADVISVETDAKIGFDLFQRTFLLKEVQEYLKTEKVTPASGLENMVVFEEHGYFSDKAKTVYREYYDHYNKIEDFSVEFNKIVREEGKISSLYNENPKCKIIEASSSQALENRINEFSVGVRLISISTEGNRAVILYYLQK